jgi:hypothetical protein
VTAGKKDNKKVDRLVDCLVVDWVAKTESLTVYSMADYLADSTVAYSADYSADYLVVSTADSMVAYSVAY